MIIALLLLMSCSFPSFAANWYWVGAAQNGSQYFIDNASVIKNSKAAIVLGKIVHPDGSYSLQYSIYTHLYKKWALLSAAEYDKNGNCTYSYSYSYPDWQPIIPDSMGEAVYESIYGY
ncbi:hypothetical protein [Megasphaera coli]|uniref:hypothetical protein n=1 Tax=Colibacter massiliensis TaxID=1852379 RepID=UPI00094E3713|nr:hypothetical protein [Colibacter massiliensis]